MTDASLSVEQAIAAVAQGFVKDVEIMGKVTAANVLQLISALHGNKSLISLRLPCEFFFFFMFFFSVLLVGLFVIIHKLLYLAVTKAIATALHELQAALNSCEALQSLTIIGAFVVSLLLLGRHFTHLLL
jgi:predicted transglutaminase-like protease